MNGVKGRASAFLPTFTTIVGIMNWLDLLILALLALAAFKGFQRGFIVELLSLVALVAGIWVASRFSEKVTTALGIAIDSGRKRVKLWRPRLPPFLDYVRIRELPVAGGTIDFAARRDGATVRIEAIRSEGDVSIEVIR